MTDDDDDIHGPVLMVMPDGSVELDPDCSCTTDLEPHLNTVWVVCDMASYALQLSHIAATEALARQWVAEQPTSSGDSHLYRVDEWPVQR